MADVSKFIEAKSDQLNAIDLIGGDKTVKITQIIQNGKDFIIRYEGDCGRPIKASKTFVRILSAGWGLNDENYIGKHLTVYREESVIYAGKEVGGVRIRAMESLPAKTMKIKVQESRGKFTEYVIHNLVPVQKELYPQERLNSNLDAWAKVVEAGKMTVEQIINKCESEFYLTDEQKHTIRLLDNQEEQHEQHEHN